MDLLAILQAAGPSPRESLRLTDHLVAHVPLMRVMGVSPFLRYTETAVLHVTEENELLREFQEEEMAGIVATLQSRGLAGNDLEDDWRVFQEYGGRVVFGGDLSVFVPQDGKSKESSQEETSSMTSSHPLVHLQSSDTVISVCQEGLNRSQVLAQAVFAARRALFPPSVPAMTVIAGIASHVAVSWRNCRLRPHRFRSCGGKLRIVGSWREFHSSYIRSEFDSSDPRNTSFEKVSISGMA